VLANAAAQNVVWDFAARFLDSLACERRIEHSDYEAVLFALFRPGQMNDYIPSAGHDDVS
jgi:hypothetical protein